MEHQFDHVRGTVLVFRSLHNRDDLVFDILTVCIRLVRPNFKVFHDHRIGHYIPDLFDHTFLRVLDNNIDLAEDIFMSIGKNMRPDSFAKFMSDKAQVHDFMRLIAAVPKQPFIKAVLS